MSEEIVQIGQAEVGQWYKGRASDLGGQDTRVVYRKVMQKEGPGVGYYSSMPPYITLLTAPVKKRGEAEALQIGATVTRTQTNLPIGSPISEPPASVLARVEKWARELKGINYGTQLGVTLGADPEIFVVDKDNKVIPAWKFLPQKSKTSAPPQQFWDGFQGEWTVVAQGCLAYMTDYVQQGMFAVLRHARAKFPEARLTHQSVLEVEREDLIHGEEEHVQLGCSPSLNIYEEFTPPVRSGRELPIRFAGSHIHFGAHKGFYTDRVVLNTVRAMDQIAGVYVTALLDGLEEPTRRQFYGRPGEYRVSKDRDRLEYRVFGSGVLIHPAIFHLSVDVLRIAWKLGVSGLAQHAWDCKPEKAREIILGCDVKGARKVLNANHTVLQMLLKRIYGAYYTSTGYSTSTIHSYESAGTRLAETGVKEWIDVSPGSMEKAWGMPKEVGGYSTWAGHSGNSRCTWKSFASLTPALTKSA